MSQPEPREVDLRQFASKVQAFGFDFVLEEFDRSWHAPEGISVQTPYTEYLRSKGRLEASLTAADSVQALMTEIGHPLKLSDVDVPESKFMDIAMHAVADPAVMFNPRPPGGPAGILEVFKAAK